MPKQQLIMPSTTSDSSKNDIDAYWLALKKEYDDATKHKKKNDELAFEKEKDDFANMWCAAGLDTKEMLMKNHIMLRKKN